jgi:flagellar M-ring protein FliF
MDKLNAMMKQLAAIWKRISFNQRVSIVLVAVAAFVGLWIFARLSHQPSQALDQADAAAIADKLRDENVPFQIRDGGRRIYVPSQRVDELRLAMASAGLPANAGGTGWAEIFNKRGLGGQSETMINLNKLRALQGELARTISSLAGVQSARVHLVMPEHTLFEKDQKPAKASVLLTLRPGYELGPAEVSGIRYLCASAIEGLKTGNITILDGNGQVLAKPRDDETMLDMTSEQFALARSVEKQLTDKIAAGLDPALGPGNWTAAVTVELDAKSLETQETTSKSGVVVEEETSEHKSQSTESTSSGEPGAVPNIDVSASGGGSGGGSTDTEKTMRMRTVPDTTVRKTVVPPGSIKTVSASVIINKDRKPTTENGTTLSVAAVEELVKAIIMYDSTRGDQVSVQEASFVKAAAADATAASMPSPVITAIAKHGPAAIVSIALLGFLWVFMKKTRYADHGAQLGAAMAAAGAGGGPGPHRKVVLPDGSASDKRVQEIFDDIVLEDAEAELRGLREAMAKLAEEKPESVAAVIRDWLS